MKAPDLMENQSNHRIHESLEFVSMNLAIFLFKDHEGSQCGKITLSFDCSQKSGDPISKFEFLFISFPQCNVLQTKSTSPSRGSATWLTALWEAVASIQEECGAALIRGNTVTHPSSHCIHRTGRHNPAR